MAMLDEGIPGESAIDRVTTNHASLLIVDDHLDNVRSLAALLRDSGYSVRKATSGEMALATIEVAQPDLVLLDIWMPDMDGYAVCERLKANPCTSRIPIIFLSASNDTEDKVRAFAIGGADYVTKPFHAEEVLARVRHQVTILRQQQQLVKQNHQLRQTEAALQQANRELKRIANTDGLTQIPNRRCFDVILEQEWQRLKREQQPLSLILCDIDHFKQYNDRYGHLAGDDCLQQVAMVISESVRCSSDTAARYGGEEFALILPNTDQQGAIAIASTIRSTLQSLQIPHSDSAIATHITVSLGIACIVPTSNSSCQQLIAAADIALYEAKAAGRNTWKVAIVPA